MRKSPRSADTAAGKRARAPLITCSKCLCTYISQHDKRVTFSHQWYVVYTGAAAVQALSRTQTNVEARSIATIAPVRIMVTIIY